MKIIVAYFSQSGNTKKIAEAIFGEIQAEKEIKPLNEIDSLEGYDFAFVGFPIQRMSPAQPAQDFLAQKAKSGKLALFLTHAAPDDSGDLTGLIAKCKEAVAGAEVVDVFDCQGHWLSLLKTE